MPLPGLQYTIQPDLNTACTVVLASPWAVLMDVTLAIEQHNPDTQPDTQHSQHKHMSRVFIGVAAAA